MQTITTDDLLTSEPRCGTTAWLLGWHQDALDAFDGADVESGRMIGLHATMAMRANGYGKSAFWCGWVYARCVRILAEYPAWADECRDADCCI